MRVGIDTGGTFTDAALLNAEGEVLFSAKSPTTHRDLIGGVAGALDQLLDLAESAGIGRAEIGSVALSTTLATNAMVERSGVGAGLVLVGFDGPTASRVGGLDQASAVVRLEGGHDAQGRQLQELAIATLEKSIDKIGDVEAIAVASLFAVRNDAHELAVREWLATNAATSHIPVTCSHELSGRLDGPKRASTALANAVLTAPVRRLLDAFERAVEDSGIAAPLVVVRSDGSVMSIRQARERPVETILSGPSASLVGGLHLAGLDDALIIDVGGTTTDVAIVSDRVPEVVDDGATVGGVSTMIRSPRITTEGLGGDSGIGWDDASNELTIGPGRVIPYGVAQVRYPQLAGLLRRQTGRRIVNETDGLFFIDESDVLVEATGAFATRRDFLAARRSVQEGTLRLVSLTPTDAAWALGLIEADRFGSAFDVDASNAGLELFAAMLDRYGEPRFADSQEAARQIVDSVSDRTGAVVAAAIDLPPKVWASVLQRSKLFRVGLEIDRPIVGIGASASVYHPALEELLGTSVIVPDRSEVANAVGAAVGAVRMQVTASITSPKRAGFVLHRPGATCSFETLEEAVVEGTQRLERHLRDRYESSGIASQDAEVDISIVRHDNIVRIDGADFFVECLLEGTLRHDVGTNPASPSS